MFGIQMSSHHFCHHRSCRSRVQAKLPPTELHNCCGPRLLSSPFILSSRCFSQRVARLAAMQCSSNPDGPQRVSAQSPAGETLSASLPSSRVLLAVGSIGLAVIAFVASRSLLGRPALDELRLQSMPLHSALANGRPTVLEFYADWCEVCGELAPTALQVGPGSCAVSATGALAYTLAQATDGNKRPCICCVTLHGCYRESMVVTSIHALRRSSRLTATGSILSC